MLKVGLTGGIASGKSTVSSMFKEIGTPVIDADVIAREVVQQGEEAYEKIVSHFGENILQDDGNIDRKKLGEIIFNNEQKRERLNRIVHPAVRTRMLTLVEYYEAKGLEMIVLDIPLLFESNLMNLVDKTLLVYVNSKTQLLRLMERNGFNEDEARVRISSQMPLDHKRKLADEVINNNGTIHETKDQLLKIITKFRKEKESF